MSISWILKDNRITSVLIGASKTTQIIDSAKAIENTHFTKEELRLIDEICKG
jgi:L-glyceraldehyde 3-phosphate reductase